MLESIRKGQRWLTILFIAVIGGVFVFFLGLGGGGGPIVGGAGGEAVVVIDDLVLDRLDFERLRASQVQRLEEQLGDQLDRKTAQAFIDQQSLRLLVEMAVLAHSADEIGMRASKREIQQLIRSDPSWQDENGRFDRERFVDVVEYQFGSQRLFLESMELELLRGKMLELLLSQVHVSAHEARSAALAGLQTVQIAYVALDPKALPAGEEVAEDEARAFAEANAEELQKIYQERQAAYTTPERVRASHILIKVEEEADEAAVEAAREKAQAARDRIVAGEGFAEVATELSDDPGSAEAGGDLGLVSRELLSAELADAAFALAPGVLSELVRSNAGFHVVRIDEKQPAGVLPFADVELDIANELATEQRATQRANDLADALSDAIRGGANLEDAARERGLTLERTGQLKRRADGFVEGLGAAPELLAAAFALENEGDSSARVFDVEGKLVLLQLIGRGEPGSSELDEMAMALEPQLESYKRNEAVREWIARRQIELSEAGRLIIDASLVTGS